MRLGTSELLNVQSGIQRKVIEAITHPKYKAGRSYFDVGIAKSDEVIEFTARVMPICLPMRPIDDADAFAGMYVKNNMNSHLWLFIWEYNLYQLV